MTLWVCLEEVLKWARRVDEKSWPPTHRLPILDSEMEKTELVRLEAPLTMIASNVS